MSSTPPFHLFSSFPGCKILLIIVFCFYEFFPYLGLMGRLTVVDKITIKLKKELADPKITSLRKNYLLEKIRILGEFMVKK